MTKKRKTVEVEHLRKLANTILAQSEGSKEYRDGVIAMIERVLHDTGNYCGFGYLYKHEVPFSQRAGINGDPSNENIPHTDYTERFKDTDHTRVQYY